MENINFLKAPYFLAEFYMIILATNTLINRVNENLHVFYEI